MDEEPAWPGDGQIYTGVVRDCKVTAMLFALKMRALVACASVLGMIAAALASPVTVEPQVQGFNYTNRLIESNNPYLLLHAHNPVDWYPWGPEAIAKALREDKPIFLSVGYSTCYWCHVAERTLYSDPQIAALMNAWFINVKVDREQRPDIDELYMLARQLIAGDGGWPNNVFLTPDLKPFYAGSYFPPATDQAGRPGFPEVLRTMHQVWTARKAETLAFADQVYARMRAAQERSASGGDEAEIAPGAWLFAARTDYLRQFDAVHGGQFSRGSGMKFPRAPMLELLLLDYRMTHDPEVLRALRGTLDAMAYGGIYDHLGGGFHRYSTEPTWSVPHFEKMLYDNAQLLRLYAEAYKTTGSPLYRYIAEDVAAYLVREMMSSEGGFYTAQDAQVDGVEGASYRWRREDIERILGAQAAARFFRVFELTAVAQAAIPTDLDDDVGGVLRVRLPIEATLQRAGFNDSVTMLSALAPLRRQLLQARNKRPQPLRDEKFNVDLNGLAIEAFVVSGRILGKPDYSELAKRAAERIWARAYDPTTGRLMHQMFRGRVQTAGFLADYALFGRALMALHGVTGDKVWQDRAAAFADGIIKRFVATDGALTMSAGETNLLMPMTSTGDRVYPSGTSAAIDLVLQLSQTNRNDRYAATLDKVLRHYSAQIDRFPEEWATVVVALNMPNAEKAIAKATAVSTTAMSSQTGGTVAPQTSDHVRVVAEVRAGRDGDTVVVGLTIDAGYHVNANPASLDYLIPTTLTFEKLSPTRIDYPQPVSFEPSFAKQPLDVYEGKTAVVAFFPHGMLKQRSVIRATVRAQACTEQICLPPSDLAVSVKPSDRPARSLR